MINNRKKKSTLIYEAYHYSVNQAKWEAARNYAKKKNLDFIILTEKELFNK